MSEPNPAPTIVGKQLILDGYIYYKNKINKNRYHWECRKLRLKECTARAIRTYEGGKIVVIKGPEKSPHSHPPNREEAEAETLKTAIKRHAEVHPEVPPAQIIRRELAGVSSGILSQLTERENLKKSMCRQRQRNMPPNPTSMDDLEEIPERFRTTLSELLAASPIWFLDGTFKVCPRIFTQVFTILGVIEKNRLPGEEPHVIPISFVYALLSSKSTNEYELVLRAVLSAYQRYSIPCMPHKIMMDFEKAIINACENVFPGVPMSLCFFHLGQSLYRKIPNEGLQKRYNDATDRELKIFTHMILALAFIPPTDVENAFRLLSDEVPEDLLPIIDYFEEYYIVGRRARGRRTAVPPRYPVPLWNQFQATLNGSHKTNNISEGGHNQLHWSLPREDF
ncbi:uncharacterized protein LOC127287979 [Leptopilina boulardi]|uniref:uncharacterized protein LOC127287979 n=1 Tax=Leptopilina boulardi TaxID=63433 RepID=UPI0021F52FC8|nr:uncharacterized protein LOC127287979 [Leptopilina boulardi]